MSRCDTCKEKKPDVFTLPNGHSYCEQCADRVCAQVFNALARNLAKEKAVPNDQPHP